MKRFLVSIGLALAVAAALYGAGFMPASLLDRVKAAAHRGDGAAPPKGEPRAGESTLQAPLVSVAVASPAAFVERVLVTGTLVPREEILVAPEVDGLRVLDVRTEAGERVRKGDILATLVPDILTAQLSQSEAALAKADAAIARARSQVTEAEAREKEAVAAFERAKPLRQAGHLSQSVYEEREAAARAAKATLAASRDSLAVAEAEKRYAEAQHKEMLVRMGRQEVTAPADGIVSRRTARIGAMATLTGEPMFRIIAKGEIELDAEVTEADLARISVGDPARISVAGLKEPVTGEVRLVPPEVDKATRLGHVRIFLGDNPQLRIGAFGYGDVETRKSHGLGVPVSSVMYGPDGPYVLVADGQSVRRRNISLGLAMDDLVEVREGLAEGEQVVAKAGTFLRDGDAIRPVRSGSGTVTDARPGFVTEARP